jgi:hypothetical protein
LKEAITNAMKDASVTWAQIDFRITDANGEQYWFKEASLALTRTLRIHKEEVDLWHPADSIGEIGAAIVPCVVGVSLFAISKRYAPGPGLLCHFSADGEERGALIMQGSMPVHPARGDPSSERRRAVNRSAPSRMSALLHRRRQQPHLVYPSHTPTRAWLVTPPMVARTSRLAARR